MIKISRGFNWFKNYEIRRVDTYYDDLELIYLDGGSTSHSPGNIIIVQDLLEKYGGVRIPYVYTRDLCYVFYKPDLIEPAVMSKICDEILQSTEVDEVDMRDRIEWFKKLSDQGYYLSYDAPA